jgi:multiple sugar transport system ATP-binding protein
MGGHTLTAAVDARHLKAGEAIQLGIRPEHVLLAQHGTGPAVNAQLQHIERLGDSSLLYVQATGQSSLSTVKVDGSVSMPAHTPLALHLLPEHLHVFDSQGLACARTVALPQ